MESRVNDPDWYNDRLSLLVASTRHLSRDEMDSLVAHATELERGEIGVRSHVVSRHLVARLSADFEDEPTIERAPSDALLKAVSS
jgi:hypothetical protein